MPPVAEAVRPRDHEDAAAVIPLLVWLTHEHDQWYALAEDFDAAGVGASPHAAIDDMCEVLGEYLHACAAEGLSLDEARRPISRGRKLGLRRAFFGAWIRRKGREAAQRYRLPYEPEDDLCW